LTIPVYPLIPRESRAVEVKGRNGDVIFFSSVIVGEKLTDLKYPSMCMNTV